jgi:hypothetical protein
VAFARVIPGKWKSLGAARRRLFVVEIDFADFERIVGDKPAVASFNAAWAMFTNLST